MPEAVEVHRSVSRADFVRTPWKGVVAALLRFATATSSHRPDTPSIETWDSRLLRHRFNWFPCYRRTGARITHISADLLEVRVELPLNRRTRGYWGATFGGSMYGALDPVLLVMLSRNLGPDYMVWDKAARIEFKKPGRSTLYGTFRLEAEEIARIKEELGKARRILREYGVDLVDGRGVVHASCCKTLQIHRARSSTRARRGIG
jgi:acyl-coenzyme A thioesterase PaaI-like protein